MALGNLGIPLGNGSYVPAAGGTMTGELVAPDFKASGLTGAVAASRYVGATASGAPVAGTFAVGDFVVDQTGRFFICTGAGTPGTWVQSGIATFETQRFIPAKVMDATQGAPNYSVSVLGASGQRLGAFMMDDGTAGTNENVLGVAPLPSTWTTFDVVAQWANGGAGSGDVVWKCDYLLIGPATALAAETAGSNVTATAGVASLVIETTVNSGIARGSADLFRFELQRVGSAAGDTLVGDVGLIGVFLRRAS